MPHSSRIAVIFLQPACNMTCNFCVTRDDFDVMSRQQARELVGALKAQGFDSIVLGGGEPLTWSGDPLELAGYAKTLGLEVQVGTNAVALTPKVQGCRDIDRFVLPLESVSSDIHNSIRQYRQGHQQIVLDALRGLKEIGKSVTVSTVITKVNKDGLKDLALFLKDMDVPGGFIHAWHLYKFIPLGRGGGAHANELSISDEEYAGACAQALSVSLAFDVYRRADMYHSKTVDFFWREKGRLCRIARAAAV